jgi:tetratricopeptide (TPR) repeat protein
LHGCTRPDHSPTTPPAARQNAGPPESSHPNFRRKQKLTAKKKSSNLNIMKTAMRIITAIVMLMGTLLITGCHRTKEPTTPEEYRKAIDAHSKKMEKTSAEIEKKEQQLKSLLAQPKPRQTAELGKLTKEIRNLSEEMEKHLEEFEKLEKIKQKIQKSSLQALFESCKMEGQAWMQIEKYQEAIDACSKALEKIPRASMPEQWATLQALIGDAASIQAIQSQGDAPNQYKQAIGAYHAALEIFTRKTSPKVWAAIQTRLGLTLQTQANASNGTERARLLNEAAAAHHAALKVHTRDQFPINWAETQANLGAILQAQARTSNGTERVRLLNETVSHFKAALEALPEKYQIRSSIQHQLAKALAEMETSVNPGKADPSTTAPRT